MTHNEFRQWWTHHCSRFTAVIGWLAKFPSEPRGETDITQARVVDSWRVILREVELNDACEASDLLACGTEDFSERGYDCHPRDVRRIARRLAEQRGRNYRAARRHVDGQPTYRCPLCRDEGRVFVVHSETIRQAIDDPAKFAIKGHVYTAVAACECDAGREWERRGLTRRTNRIPLMPDTAVRLEDKRQVVMDFVNGRQVSEWANIDWNSPAPTKQEAA